MTNTDTEHTSDAPIHDVIIVGSGPAGYTAAVYAARAEMSPVLFEGTQFGGALMTTTEVENHPGFREGIQGPDLMDEMREQALRFGADLRMEDVDAPGSTGRSREVEVAGDVHRARAVILAMGRPHATSASPASRNCWAAVCHPAPPATGSSSRIRTSRSSAAATRRWRRPPSSPSSRAASPSSTAARFRSSKIMLERARANEKIRFVTNATVGKVLGESSVTGLEAHRHRDRSDQHPGRDRHVRRHRPRPA